MSRLSVSRKIEDGNGASGDQVAGAAGFEVEGSTNYDFVRTFNERAHSFDMDGYLQMHNSPTTSA
jgi:hypothetical protein